MKISLIRAEDACTAVRSERGACTAESGSATMAGGVCQMLWSEAATLRQYKLPTGAMPLLCASEVCCAVVVLLWTAVVLVYARGTYALSK